MYSFKSFKLTKENIWSASIVLFITSLFFPFGQALRYFLLGSVAVISLYIAIKEKQINFRPKLYRYSFLFIALFLLYVLISFFTSGQTDGFRSIRIRLPLFIFPLIFCCMRISRTKRDDILLKTAFITTLATLVSALYAISQAVRLQDKAWLYNDALSFFINQQSIYTSLLVNISIYTFIYFLLSRDKNNNPKLLLIVSTGFLFIISYLLASRIMMLQLYASLGILVFFIILKRKKWLEGVTLLLGMVIAVFLILKFFPNTLNRFKELTYTDYTYDNKAAESHYAGTLTAEQWNGANFRIAAWKCGWELFTQHPVTGVGIGDKTSTLNELYKQKKFWFAIETGKNVHNNYLDILYSTGIIGLCVFLMGWFILPFLYFIPNKDYLAIIVTLTFACAMITEVYFDRSLGAILFGFFIPFLLISSGKRNNHSLAAS